MNKANLIFLKEQYNVNDEFINILHSLFEKLEAYGYTSTRDSKKLINKLTQNVDSITIGYKNIYDYKNGYYDANKKELYFKNLYDIPNVYLRLIYAMTTNELAPNMYQVGYSITKLRKDSYRLMYENFGLNRAVASNIVCKICNMLPSEFQIINTNKTYTHNFLGYKINSPNDIYFIEGVLLLQFCFCMEIDPEILYSNLFRKNPTKVLDNILTKKKFVNKDDFIALFDKISKNYNAYNKLAFLSNKLNENYVDYKKNVLNKNIDKIKKEEILIKQTIDSVIDSIFPKGNDVEEEIENNYSLSESLEKLESAITHDIIGFQNILAKNIINTYKNLPAIKYSHKLKLFNEMLIIPNEIIFKEIQHTILDKLMPYTEVTEINLIQKIKYAIIEDLLKDSNNINISNSFTFFNITNFEDSDLGKTLIILNLPNKTPRLIEVQGLNNNINLSKNFKLSILPIDNFKYIINSNYTDSYIGNIEKLFTSVKNNFEEFKNISLDDIFAFNYESKYYLIVFSNGKPCVILYNYSSGYVFNKLNLSEEYTVFGKQQTEKIIDKSNLPVLQK